MAAYWKRYNDPASPLSRPSVSRPLFDVKEGAATVKQNTASTHSPQCFTTRLKTAHSLPIRNRGC
jgi:hypothetical protein